MPEETSTASSSAGMDEKPCSSSVVDSSIDVTEEAKKLIGTGNRHLVMGDVVSAVNVFQEACGMLAARYGDTAEECGEAFFLCGKSLLELARMENTVLGNALEGVPQSDEEEKPVSENIESANNLDDDDDDDDDEDEANADDAEDEDVGNLQLAWEMLEVAKFIYKRKESKEDQLMAAQAYLKLGEVSVESGNYPQALEDFQECLTLQLKHLPPSSRLLAESNYHVAQTLCYMDAYSQAIEHYNRSIEVIENRLAVLQKVIDAAEGAEGADGAAKEKTEQEELRQLLPEVTEKVADAKESQRAASLAIRQALDGASTSSGFSAENGGPSSSSSSSAFASASQISTRPFEGASSSKSTSDISHLVRKKRKTDEESLVKDADAKQPKQESTVNGGSSSSSSNGKGVQEKEPAETSASKSSE
ncbi:nuclear autoantigenic sperm protein isoform X2 [Gadus morhua]|uniref:nuclear autoantigenic sperm protein isoform X2 n=1 Tax=Gadus morhua TaxID=8049 RepID=UPI0011B7C6AC|nr:nuclear autoantigenic sperm protein isoform X2 [Gadus morhua]